MKTSHKKREPNFFYFFILSSFQKRIERQGRRGDNNTTTMYATCTTHTEACASAMDRLQLISSKSKLIRRDDIAQVHYENVEIDYKSLGSGNFSQVHRVKVQDSKDDRIKDGFYALKCLSNMVTFESDGCFETALLDLALEADILSRLYHPNIIQLHGVMAGCISRSFDQSNVGYFVLLDLLEHTLESRLLHWRVQKRRDEAMGICPSQQDVLRTRVSDVAIGIARGMEYLHAHNVILRDLKPENVGFDQNGIVKIFDFGFAREIHTCLKKEVAGSLRYMSPEHITTLATNYRTLPIISLSSDVYSFGILLWEICTLQTPFKHVYTPIELFETVVKRKWRPSVRSIPSKLIRTLISNCWSTHPKNRPTFRTIRTQLELKLVPREQRRLLRQSLLLRTITTTNNDNGYVFSRSLSRPPSSCIQDLEDNPSPSSIDADPSSSTESCTIGSDL